MKFFGPTSFLILFMFTLQLHSVHAQEEIPTSLSKIPPKRHTLKELRDRHIVRQQLDYSCGAAALATLLTYYFEDETSEREVLRWLESHLSQQELEGKQKTGFSLLDLKEVSESKGYRAAGFKINPSHLEHLLAPVIVFVQPMGYKHFAVLRGVINNYVYLADPSRGNLRMTMSRFLEEWQGIVFVLGKDGEEQKKTYPLALQTSDLPFITPYQGSRMGDMGVRTNTQLSVRIGGK